MPPHSRPIIVAMGIGAIEAVKYTSSIRPYMTMKMQMATAKAVTFTNRLWNHSPTSGPMSISMSRSSRPAVMDEMSTVASLTTTPAAPATTL